MATKNCSATWDTQKNTRGEDEQRISFLFCNKFLLKKEKMNPEILPREKEKTFSSFIYGHLNSRMFRVEQRAEWNRVSETRFHGRFGSFSSGLAPDQHLPHLDRVQLLHLALGSVVPGNWVGHPCILHSFLGSFLHHHIRSSGSRYHRLRRSRVSPPAPADTDIINIW